MSFIHSPVDVVVLTALLLGYAYIMRAFIIAKRPKHIIAIWGAFGALFLLLELVLAPSGNTLSENLVESIGWQRLVIGTIVFCVILNVHWPDLDNRLTAKVRSKLKPGYCPTCFTEVCDFCIHFKSLDDTGDGRCEIDNEYASVGGGDGCKHFYCFNKKA